MRAFLSHSNEDTRIAHTLRRVIEDCSLGKASVWFSSDTSPTGGVDPGELWLGKLMDELSKSDACIALMTPQSVNSSWLYFEVGCALTRGIPVYPLAAGLSTKDLKAPIDRLQVKSASTPATLKEFVMRIYADHGIAHTDQMLEHPMQLAVQEISRATSEARASTERDPDSDIARLSALIDRRFLDLIERLPVEGLSTRQMPTFSVSFSVVRRGKEIDDFAIDIADDDTFKNVTDACYFALDGKVDAFKYLEEWVIHDATQGVNLIVREIGPYVRASAIIRPGNRYEIILLSQPYDPAAGSSQTLR